VNSINVVVDLRIWSLRLVYVALLASSVLYAGAGDARAALLTLATSLSLASMVELYLNAYEAVFSLLLLGAALVGAVAFYAYPDFNARFYVVLCVLAPLVVYAIYRKSIEGGWEESTETEVAESEVSSGDETSGTP
jgi:hypothetical protein